MLFRRAARGIFVGIAAFLFIYGVLSFFLELTLQIPPPRLPCRGATLLEQEFFDSSSGLLSASPETIWEPVPGARGVLVQFNKEGFRGKLASAERPAGFVRIAVVGDGASLGVNVKPEVAWPAVLEELMRVYHYQGEVLNFSVPGFTAVQGNAYYKKRVAPFDPDILIISFGGIHETEAPPSGLRDCEMMQWCASARFRLRRFFDKFGAARWASGNLYNFSTPASRSTARGAPSEFESAVGEMINLQKSRGKRAVLVVPSYPKKLVNERPSLDSFAAALRRAADSSQTPIVSFTEAWRNANLADFETVFANDHYYRTTAQLQIAECVGRALLSNKILPPAGERK